MGDCIFCKIIEGSIPANKVYEDEFVLAFMDIQPINKGHVLVIPKKHAALVHELDDDSASKVFQAGRKISAALRKSGTKCEAVNLFIADGKAAGQEVFHVHLHVIPRFEGDGFGLKFPDGYESKPTGEELAEMAGRIKDAVEG